MAQNTPSFTHEALERGRKLFAGPCDFLRGVVDIAGLPSDERIEIAFAGRSNVGKSSLLNALTNRNALARTSNTPGRTRELNFFTLGDEMHLVDLPCYGYARVSRKQVHHWTGLIKDYLRGRACLRRVCVLIDARHGLKKNDLDILDMLDIAAVPYQIILTKADKVKTKEMSQTLASTEAALAKRPAAHPLVHVTSSEKKIGFENLRADLAQILIQ